MRKAVAHLKKADPVMRGIIERIGPCRMEFSEPEFHKLAEAIIYQQLNGKAAATIFKRFITLAGGPLTTAGLLKLTQEQMRSVGLSKQKSGYLRDLAQKTDTGLLDFSRLPILSDAEVIDHLTQVKGIGVWTAQMFLMFALRRENVLPMGDFGVRMAVFRHYLDNRRAKLAGGPLKIRATAKKARIKIRLPKPKQIEKIAKRWEPYRSVACWYLWRSLDTKTI